MKMTWDNASENTRDARKRDVLTVSLDMAAQIGLDLYQAT